MTIRDPIGLSAVRCCMAVAAVPENVRSGSGRGHPHLHLPVEPPRTPQGRVQRLRPIGCGHDDHRPVAAATAAQRVHLRQQGGHHPSGRT